MEIPLFKKDDFKHFLKYQLDGKKGIRAKNQDRVICIMGNEGIGKSHLALWLFIIWYEEVLGIKLDKEKFLTHFTAENDKFNSSINLSNKYDMNVHDEAILLTNSRRAMSKTNVDNNETYMIIRGLNLYTIFNIPSILDMDGNFRNRRVRVMFYVSDFGKAFCYGRKKLNELIPAMNKSKSYNSNPDPLCMKNQNGDLIIPDFELNYPEYKGDFRKIYEEMKQTSMSCRLKANEEDDDLSRDNIIALENEQIKRLMKIHKTKVAVAKEMKMPESTLRSRLKAMERNF